MAGRHERHYKVRGVMLSPPRAFRWLARRLTRLGGESRRALVPRRRRRRRRRVIIRSHGQTDRHNNGAPTFTLHGNLLAWLVARRTSGLVAGRQREIRLDGPVSRAGRFIYLEPLALKDKGEYQIGGRPPIFVAGDPANYKGDPRSACLLKWKAAGFGLLLGNSMRAPRGGHSAPPPR